MTMMPRHNSMPRTALAMALLTAINAAAAEDDELKQASVSESTVSVGAGLVTKDNQRFGQYTGLEENKYYGLLDVDAVKRDDATGTWLKLNGQNLGLDSRELRFEHKHQGSWGYYLDYNQIPQFSPYIVNTGLQGIGGNNPTNMSTTSPKRDVQLGTERKILSFGIDKTLESHFDFQVRYRNENKEGTRMWGGETGGNMAFIAEPIDTTTQQLEATFGYHRNALQLAGGYYATAYTNHDPFLSITPAPASNLISPAPLPPSNQSHQLFFSGGYGFTPTMRGTFKLSYTIASQEESFVYGNPTGTLLNNRNDPGGRVDTTLAQFGLTAQPLPKLSLLAKLRYENRDDRTPEVPYVTASSIPLTNTVFSRTTTNGKFEASYQLPDSYRITGGVDLDNTNRTVPVVRIVSWRQKTDETTYRMELRRSMTETVNGAVSVIHSERSGSTWMNNSKGTTAYTTSLAPIIWADRERDKLRLAFDWAATEALSLQFIAEDGRDLYSGLPLGPQRGDNHFYSVDAAYSFTESWKASAWVSRSDSQLDQQSRVTNATTVDINGVAIPNNTIWGAQLGNKGDSLGLGLNGKPTGKLEIGANVQYTYDRSTQDMSLANSATLPPLAEIDYKTTRLQLFGKYALEKNLGVRLDIAHERRYTNDWTWSGFVYPQDGTTVSQEPRPRVTFVGVSAYYHFQ